MDYASDCCDSSIHLTLRHMVPFVTLVMTSSYLWNIVPRGLEGEEIASTGLRGREGLESESGLKVWDGAEPIVHAERGQRLAGTSGMGCVKAKEYMNTKYTEIW